MTNLQNTLENLFEYQIVHLIEDRMETLADLTGYTPTSITRITGWSDDTKRHDDLKKILTTVKMKGITKDDLIEMYTALGRVSNEWEVKGL